MLSSVPRASPLKHDLIHAPQVVPKIWAFFLHGILGQGKNWRAIASSFVRQQPSWGVILPDLRMHGFSQGFSPPHSVATCARDLDELVHHCQAAGTIPGDAKIGCALGHSFGGKVALQYAQDFHTQDLQRVIVVDSSPGPKPFSTDQDRPELDSVPAVLDILDRLTAPGQDGSPRVFGSPDLFVQEILNAGLSKPVGQWLAFNLRKPDFSGAAHHGPCVFGIDLSAIRVLINDYCSRDLWPFIERSHDIVPISAILGGNSRVVDNETQHRLRQAGVSIDIVEGASHWVQADNPRATLNLVVQLLSTHPPS
eukprot:gnl/Spiro4/21937_TR10767_c0_g1_i1.p1 gnl/Spiro4/21937_TR10767_c0_g1~~gnl/Spiro4/21937_TR10767_c0_g1_i1.p1  ORF type:complete len:310 (+),score=4.85 gnl/Spiro4/21937_TR10767_c0_g1_i1:54-983(+)